MVAIEANADIERLGRSSVQTATELTPLRVRQLTILGPKSVLPLLVSLIFAEFDWLAVLHSPDAYFRKRCGDIVSSCIDCDQGDDEIVFSQHIMHINAENASGELHRALEKASDLIMAGIVA